MKNKIIHFRSLLKLITLSLIIGAISACSKDDTTPVKEWPETISLNEASLYPEGIVYSNELKKLFVGSYYKGKIVTVDVDGKLEDFVIDPSLISVTGMAIYPSKNWLVVCNSDGGISENSDQATTARVAQVIVYDLSTGAKIRTTDLMGLYQGGHFANDVRLDNSGNSYVTDSFSPLVYKIDASGNASILVNNSSFMPPQGAFGLNGIIYHPDNFLIAGMAYNGKLYKIPLDNPENVTEISVNAPVNSLDGLLLTDNNTLILVSNNFTGAPFDEAVYKLNTTDNWTSATVAGTFTNLAGVYPTTATEIDNKVYVNFAYFPSLAAGGAPIETFKIQHISF
jgi:sugar lactone lactonase YvrE